MNAYEIERFKMQKFLQDYTILLIPFCFTVKSFIHSNINSIELFAVVFTCTMSSIDYFCTICWEQKFKTKVFYCIFSDYFQSYPKLAKFFYIQQIFAHHFSRKQSFEWKTFFENFFSNLLGYPSFILNKKKKKKKK